MSEEIKIVAVPDKPGAFKTEDGKQFVSQELTDRLIQQRLGEEKIKWEATKNDAVSKVEQAKAAAESALTEAQTKLQTLESASATVEQSNKALQETFDTIMSGLSDEAKALVPDYGTLTDKIKFINKNSARFFNTNGAAPNKLTPPVAPKDPPIDAATQRTLPTLQDMLKPGGAQAAIAAMDALAKQ